jgi:hypothetical protein
MKPEVAFDVCHDVYLVAREALDGDLAASNLSSQAEYLWRPDIRPRLTEYVADFALAGRKALSAPSLASRAALFSVYYVGCGEIHSARKYLGIGEITWAQWVDDIRTRVGGELLRRGMCPPRDYFRKMSAKRRAA